MRILQIGSPKCGNLWLYKILEEILDACNQNQYSFIEQQPIYQLAKNWDLNYPEQAQIDMIDITDLQTSYRISSIYRMPIDNMKEYISKTGHVWTHSPICKSSEEVFSYFDKKLYIIRDPRDRAISASKYYCSPYMLKYFPQPEENPKRYLAKHFDELMQTWTWHVFDHLKFRKKYNIHILFYESFLLDFQNELDRLLDYLNLKLPADQKKTLEENVSFRKMKKENPKHLKKGIHGYWKEQLTEGQKHRATTIAGPLLKRLGYEQLGKTQEFNPPVEFNWDFEIIKQRIIESQQSR